MSYSPFYHINSVLWKRSPIQLTFFLTRRCNAKCPFCFYLSNKNISKDDKPEISLDEVKKISSSLGRLLWLAYSGGEIFLRSDIDEITNIFYKKNRPAIILFPSNGLLTEVIREKIEIILDSCRQSTIVVKLSLEGTEDVHDSIRGRGSFQKTIKTYMALGELPDKYPNFEIGINTVFCSANQDRMDDIIEYVKGLDKIKTHTVSLVRGNGLKEIDIEKYRATSNKLAENLRRKTSSIYRFRGSRIKAAQDILQRRLIYETEIQKKRLIDCYAGRLNLVLTESGDLYPCESFTKKMGNVRDNEYDINKILRTDQARDILGSIRDNGCFCSHECYLMTNILFNLRIYPKLFREYLRLS